MVLFALESYEPRTIKLKKRLLKVRDCLFLKLIKVSTVHGCL